MSDFPVMDEYRNTASQAHLSGLTQSGLDQGFPIVIKKEKNQYLYDIDQNKYVDFYMSNGTVLLGHNTRHLTTYIKDSLSAGISTSFVHKFHSRLFKLVREMIDAPFISLYQSLDTALYRLVHTLSPEYIGTTSTWLYSKLKDLFPERQVELAKTDAAYDLLLYEPVNLDGGLEDIAVEAFNAKIRCSVESRCAFRLKEGFFTKPGKADLIIISDSIANGMSSALLLSDRAFTGENIPMYQAVAVLETLKAYRRLLHDKKTHFNIKSPLLQASRGSIIKLSKKINPRELLPQGVFINGDLLFLCLEHTEYDARRLENALKSIETI